MKISWGYSLETEAKRVLHDAHQIAVGFYRVNNFHVLPYSPKNKFQQNNLVFFPDLPYHKIHRFWERVKKIDVSTLPIEVDNELVEKVAAMLFGAKIPKPEIKKLEKIWTQIEKPFFTELVRVIPSLKGSIKEIVICPTVLGTRCSFNRAKSFPAKLVFYIREDADPIYALVEAIITSLTRNRVYDLGGNWNESEFLTDWLISESSIGEIVQKYHLTKQFAPTIKTIRTKQLTRDREASEAFYKKLGLSSKDNAFGLNGLTPEIYKKPVENLNQHEKLILRTLIQKQGEVVSFDEISSLITSEEDFSLWAIAKLIERLRKKIEENGVSGSYIQTLRGKGYILRN